MKTRVVTKKFGGAVVQLVRIPACHAGGRGFESRPFRHLLRALSISSGLFLCLRFNYCSIRKNPLHFSLFFCKALKDEVIARIAVKHNATPAQVILAWAMGEGYSVIPSSTRRENLASNLLALDLHLDAEDRAAIAALDCNDRLVSPEGLAPAWD